MTRRAPFSGALVSGSMKRTSKGWMSLPPEPLPLDQLPAIASFADWFKEYGSVGEVGWCRLTL